MAEWTQSAAIAAANDCLVGVYLDITNRRRHRLRNWAPPGTMSHMVSADVSSQLRRGVLEFCVLGLLKRRDRYGFDLVRELGDLGLVAGEGTIYPLLSRLRRDRLVESIWQQSESGPPRRYYRLTAEGAARAETFVQLWMPFRDAVDSILTPETEQT
ncbi:PadR family transcriptional regulator [Metallococcus carri]|nr:PadR family transcriptional regulator [Metallococcus carri]